MKKAQTIPMLIVIIVFIAVIVVMLAFRYHADFMPILGESSDVKSTNIDLYDGKININTANAETLCALPGIGNTLASRIIEYRQRCGAFHTIKDLKNVKGINENIFHEIEAYITIGN